MRGTAHPATRGRLLAERARQRITSFVVTERALGNFTLRVRYSYLLTPARSRAHHLRSGRRCERRPPLATDSQAIPSMTDSEIA